LLVTEVTTVISEAAGCGSDGTGRLEATGDSSDRLEHRKRLVTVLMGLEDRKRLVAVVTDHLKQLVIEQCHL
jgi:hypothetical protein